VDHPLIRLLLTFFFFLFHQLFYWVMFGAARTTTGVRPPEDAGPGLLNAVVGFRCSTSWTAEEGYVNGAESGKIE